MNPEQLVVGISYTKSKKLPLAVCDALYEGVKKCGDIPFKIKTKKDLRHCDVITQYGPWNGGQETIRGDVEEFAKKNKIRKLCLDIGFIKNHRLDPDSLEAYTTIGYDDFKNYGDYYYDNHNGYYTGSLSESSRWNSFGIEIKPWRQDGEHILVLGQPQGWSTAAININEWTNSTIKSLKQYTDRPIWLRQHPLHKSRLTLEDKSVRIIEVDEHPLEKDFENCWAVVSYSSSAVIPALLAGIPIVCNSNLSIGYPLAEKNIANIEAPEMPRRRKFFYDLAYSQWNLSEIASGNPWSFYRKHYNDI